jgi:hypothetical protein
VALNQDQPPVGAGPTITLKTRSVEEVEFLQYVLRQAQRQLMGRVSYGDASAIGMAEATQFWSDSILCDHNIDVPRGDRPWR